MIYQQKIDLEVLDLFKGTITPKNNLLFKGEEFNTYSLIFDEDYSNLQTSGFFKTIRVKECIMADTVVVFNNIKSAIYFYILKGNDYFSNKLILITDNTSNFKTSKYIIKEKIKNLILYHEHNKEDLFLFYFDLFNEKVEYKLAIDDKKNKMLQFIYKQKTLYLTVNKLHEAVNLLSKDERFFRVKNNYLEEEKHQKLTW